MIFTPPPSLFFGLRKAGRFLSFYSVGKGDTPPPSFYLLRKAFIVSARLSHGLLNFDSTGMTEQSSAYSDC